MTLAPMLRITAIKLNFKVGWAKEIEGERLYSAVRFSFGRYTTEQEIKQAGDIICTEVKRLRELARL